MAIDPRIAMSFQPAQIQSPLATAGQVMSLKNAGLQQQMGQQELQEGQIRLNQAGQTWEDEQADRAAIAKNTQQDPATGQVKLNRAGYLSDLAQAAPRLSMQRAQEFATQDFQRSQLQAALTKTQLENAKAHTELIGQVAGTVTDQASYDQAKQTLQSAGLDTSRFPEAYDPHLVQQFAQQAITAKDQVDQHLAALKAQEEAQHNRVTEATGQQQAQAATTRAGAAVADSKIAAGRLGVERQRLQMEQAYMPTAGGNLTGDAFLQTLNPGIQQQVKSIASGDIKMPPTRSAAGMALRNAVMNYDPTFTDSRYDTKQNFKTKGDSQNIVQLATAMEHADNARKHSSDVGWAPFLSQNATAADAAYNKDIQYLTGEVGKLVKNGVVTEKEAEQYISGLNSSRQGIRDSALDETMKLLSGKVGGVFQKYKTGTGQDLPVDQYFDAPTQKRLQRFGMVQASTPAASASGAQTVTMRAPNGQTQPVSADQVEHYKSLGAVVVK